MNKFTTGVELHKHEEGDYDILHSAMEREGFTRTIVSDKGKEYHLPPAEYNKEGNFTIEQVKDSAKRAAAVTKKEFAVLVTESNGRSWYGLEEVKKAQFSFKR